MHPRFGFALSLLAALGIHAVILLVPGAGIVAELHIPTIELDLTQDTPRPRLAALPAPAVTPPVAAHATARIEAPREQESLPHDHVATATTAAREAPRPAALEPIVDAPGGGATGPVAENKEGSASVTAGSGRAGTRTPMVVPPLPIAEIHPTYPRSARKAGLEGVVKLTVQVDEAGTVIGADILSSSGHASLDQAALEAVRRARFSPALKDGKPVSARIAIPFRFSLVAPSP